MKTSLISVLFFSGISAGQFPQYKANSIELLFDKKDKSYMDFPIPAEEKEFTEELRKVKIKGAVFHTPLKFTPQKFDSPKTPFEALANIIYSAKYSGYQEMIKYYGKSAIPIVDSLSKKYGKDKYLWALSRVDSLQIFYIIEKNDSITIIGNKFVEKQWKGCMYTQVKENGVYKMDYRTTKSGFITGIINRVWAEASAR